MFSLTSPAFRNGETIPVKFTQEGDNISPPLEWTDIPTSARELALICEDPDAPGDEPFVHWIIYGMSTQVSGLSGAIENLNELYKPLRAQQGLNSKGQIGYVGPLPPIADDWHRYQFKLFALDNKLDLKAGANRNQFYAALQGHVIAAAELVGKYHRTKRLHEREPYQKSSREDLGLR